MKSAWDELADAYQHSHGQSCWYPGTNHPDETCAEAVTRELKDLRTRLIEELGVKCD